MYNSIVKIIELAQEKGSIGKRNIITKYQDDENFVKFLYYILNPMITYKVSLSRLDKEDCSDYNIYTTFNNSTIFEVCDKLASMPAMDDKTFYSVKSFLNRFSKEESDFYKALLSKTYRLGVTAKTVNKVIPDLIPDWEVQQAYSIEKYGVPSGSWFYVTEKLNGVRATFRNGQMISRTGIPYDGLDNIINELSIFHDIFVFDGELTLRDKSGISDNEAFRIATGLANSIDGDKSKLIYNIFDVIPISEFDSDKGETVYSKRREILTIINNGPLPNSDNIRVVPLLYEGREQENIWNLLDEAVANDKEGVMVNLETTYKRHRHNGILKVKRFYTMDLPIIGVEEGSGRLSNTLGAVVVDFHGHELRVGSGFDDNDRNNIWLNKDDYIGKIIEIKYKEVSYDKNTGYESLQFPVFVRFRNKETVSYD